MVAGVAYGAAELQLRGDDRLVLFTDGLVELRGPDLAERFAQLLDIAASAPRDADALLDVLLDRLAPPDTDDVTVVALGPSA
jgi:serine phosphatase RsbU (regulator of sigma subunit)